MSIFDEFNLTKNDVKNLLKYGAELWMTLKKIHQTACNKSQSLSIDKQASLTSQSINKTKHLSSQFE